MWVHSTDHFRYANLGDALSAVIVAGLTGMAIKPSNFRSRRERFAAIGTIAHNFVGGTVHLWGTGIDRNVNVVDPDVVGYRLPSETNVVAHAVRGPYSRAIFLEQGVDCPEVYGDAAWFLPQLYNPDVPKTRDLGVILHISELVSRDSHSGPKPEYLRYRLPEDGSVCLINTYHDPDYPSLCRKMDEILSCRRIVSTSFHGVMLAEAYGIPCAYFSMRAGGGEIVDPIADGERLDHRVRDFYAGAGAAPVTTYHQPRNKETNWADVMQHIDRSWRPLDASFQPLLDAFPFSRTDQVPHALLASLAL